MIIIFLISLWIPFLFWRSVYFLFRAYVSKPLFRTKTGFPIHHFHAGIIFVFVASLWLLSSDKNAYNVMLLGLGLGLIIDEVIPSLFLKGNRPLELKVYRQSLAKTFLLFLLLTLVIVLYIL